MELLYKWRTDLLTVLFKYGGIIMGDFNRGGSNGGFKKNFGGPREMHKAVCAECKSDCEVPFKPSEGKPVYCRDCFSKR